MVCHICLTRTAHEVHLRLDHKSLSQPATSACCVTPRTPERLSLPRSVGDMANFVVTAAHVVPSKPASPSHSLPVGVPVTQSFHWARPQSAVFASSSGALGSFDEQQSVSPNFVRPDLVEAADEALAAFVQTTNRPSAPVRPQFRSALEQVSFETNHSLMETYRSKPKNEKGLLGRAARILRK